MRFGQRSKIIKLLLKVSRLVRGIPDKKEIDDEELERISKELYECARLSNELDLRMQAVRKDIQESQKEKSNSNMFAKILAENWKK